jgi:N6-adenosine-specific RNA methylase IME4
MIPFPDKKFHIIYADPPWGVRGSDDHYDLMKTKDICALPVRSITAENAHLYLWTANNFLPDGLKVVESWGFRYITMVTWVKDKFGLGQYFRGQTEHCLFAVKGMLPYKIGKNGKRCQHPTVFHAPRDKHSRKPEEMRRIIEHVSGDTDRLMLEMFARTRTDKWEAWGNQVGILDEVREKDMFS